jgi:DNA-binding PadR family transcriptional regulator
MELRRTDKIKDKIYIIRGIQVMLDSDLAEVYQVETRVLNQAVKRNSSRFPEQFRFQLTELEMQNLRSQLVMSSSNHGGRRVSAYAFTEQGIAMLAAVLRSEIAIKVSIQIMQAFVAMRKSLGSLQDVIQRLETVEMTQLKTDASLEKVLQAFHTNQIPRKGVFFEGQLFDALVFASNLIKQAQKNLVLVDNYVNENTLLLLSKRKENVDCTIYSKPKASLLRDLEVHNKQYSPITFIEHHKSHDRFLIIDDGQLYHIGASLKDLGDKCFAFSRLDDLLPQIRSRLLNS